MNQSQVRFRVFTAGAKGQKPIFERVVTLAPGESSDSDLIVKALKKLFGKSITINAEYYDI